MSTDRDEQVIAAYAAGEDVVHIERRFGVSADEVRQIVAAGTGVEAGAAAAGNGARQRRGPLAVAGIVLTMLGLVGPCAAGVLWLAIYYLSETEYPVSSWQYGNVAVGLSGVCTGSLLTGTGLALLLVARRTRE